MKLRGEFEVTGVTTVVMDRSRAWQKSITTDGVWVKSSVPYCFEHKGVMAGSTKLSAADLRDRIQQMADEGAKVWQSGDVLNIYTKKFQRLWTFNHPVVVYETVGVAIDKKGKVVLNRNNPKMWRKRCDEELKIYDAAVAKKAAEARDRERAFEELLTEANDEMCKVAIHEACAACEHKKKKFFNNTGAVSISTPPGNPGFRIALDRVKGNIKPTAVFSDGCKVWDIFVHDLQFKGGAGDGGAPMEVSFKGWITGERKPPATVTTHSTAFDFLKRELARPPMLRF